MGIYFNIIDFMGNNRVTLQQAYQLLNVGSRSSISEIKAAYRSAAGLYHPDSHSGRSDVEKFHQIVQAYNLIINERKNHGQGGAGWLTRLFSRSREGILSLMNGAAKSGRPRADCYEGQGYWSTLNILIRKLDLAEREEERIKAARSIFRRYKSSFSSIAIPRLPTAEGPLLAEFILLLASIGGRKELEAVAPFLFCGELETMLAAYTALELSGPEGRAIAAKALGVKDSIFMRMLEYVEPASSKGNRASASRIKRARAFSRRSGAPVGRVMERLGYMDGRVA